MPAPLACRRYTLRYIVCRVTRLGCDVVLQCHNVCRESPPWTGFFAIVDLTGGPSQSPVVDRCVDFVDRHVARFECDSESNPALPSSSPPPRGAKPPWSGGRGALAGREARARPVVVLEHEGNLHVVFESHPCPRPPPQKRPQTRRTCACERCHRCLVQSAPWPLRAAPRAQKPEMTPQLLVLKPQQP